MPSIVSAFVSLLVALAAWPTPDQAASTEEGKSTVDVVLLLEDTGGMREIIANTRLPSLLPQDRIAVLTFRAKTRVRQKFTDDQQKLEHTIRQLGTPFQVGTPVSQVRGNPDVHLFRALVDACRFFHTLPMDQTGKRAIVALFGSDDFGSSPAPQEMRSAFEDARARLFAIAVRKYDWRRRFDPKVRTPPTIPGPPPVNSDRLPLPDMTIRMVSELARLSGGDVVVDTWNIPAILERVRSR